MCTWIRVIRHFASSLPPNNIHILKFILSHSQLSQDSFFRVTWLPPRQGQGVEVSILVWCQQQQNQLFNFLLVLYKFCSNPKSSNSALDLSGNCTGLLKYVPKNKAITECFDRLRSSKAHRFKSKLQELVSFHLGCFGQQIPLLLFALQRQITFWPGVSELLSYYGPPTFQLTVNQA